MMKRLRRRVLTRIVLAAGLLSFTVAPALAQEEPPPWRDPNINWMQDEKPYIQWIIGVLFVAACVAIALKNPHRSHLD